MTRSQSGLRRKILLRMDGRTIENITKLAEDIGASRPSVSRSLHAMEDEGLVRKVGPAWELTEKGQQVCEQTQLALPDEIAATGRRFGELMAQEKIAGTEAGDRGEPPPWALRGINLFAGSAGEEIARVAQQASALGVMPGLVDGTFTMIGKMVNDVVSSGALQMAARGAYALDSLKPPWTGTAMGRDDAREKIARLGATASEAMRALARETFASGIASEGLIRQYQSMMAGLSSFDLEKQIAQQASILSGRMGEELDRTRQLAQLSIDELCRPRLNTHELIDGLRLSTSTLLQTQQFNLAAIASVREVDALYEGVARSLGGVLGKTNQALAGMLGKMNWLEEIAGQLPGPHALALTTHLPSVSTSYAGLFRDSLSHFDLDMAPRVPALLVSSTRATGAYLDSVVISVADSTGVTIHDEDPVEVGSQQVSSRVMQGLARVAPYLPDKVTGAWATLNSNNPDRVAQASHSIREVLTQTLDLLAPDEVFTEDERRQHGAEGKKVTRKMRVAYILAGGSKSAIMWVCEQADAIEASYNRLCAEAHMRSVVAPGTVREVAGLMIATMGWLEYLFARYEGCND